MTTLPELTIRDCVFALHHILVKGFENPELTQRLTDFFYDKLSKHYTDLEEFTFNDFDCSYKIKTLNYHEELEHVVKMLYTEFVLAIFHDQYCLQILMQYDYDRLICYLTNTNIINIAARECITFLNLSNAESSVYKINLHN